MGVGTKRKRSVSPIPPTEILQRRMVVELGDARAAAKGKSLKNQ